MNILPAECQLKNMAYELASQTWIGSQSQGEDGGNSENHVKNVSEGECHCGWMRVSVGV